MVSSPSLAPDCTAWQRLQLWGENKARPGGKQDGAYGGEEQGELRGNQEGNWDIAPCRGGLALGL